GGPARSTHVRLRGAAGHRPDRGIDRSQGAGGDSRVGTIVVSGDGLRRDLSGVSHLLGARIAGLVPLIEKRRNRNRGQDSNDEHDEQQLYQGETLLAGHPLSELQQHLNLLGSVAARAPCRWESLPRWQPGWL